MKNQTTMELWQEYKNKQSAAIRQELIVRYLGLVKYVVRKMIKSYPQAIEETDLYHIGILGLAEALDRFDLEYGIKFETYAIPRIKGSIIDELRKLDWVPRSLRNKSNMFKEKTIELEQKYAGSFSDDEVAIGLGINVDELHSWKKDMNTVNILSLDKPIDDAYKQNLYDMVEDEDDENAEIRMEEEEMKRVLLKAIKQTSRKNPSCDHPILL